MTTSEHLTIADRYAELLTQTEATLRRSQAILHQAESVLDQAQRIVTETRQRRAPDHAARWSRGGGGHDRSPAASGATQRRA